MTPTLPGGYVDPATLPAGGALAGSPAMFMAQRRSMMGRRAFFRG